MVDGEDTPQISSSNQGILLENKSDVFANIKENKGSLKLIIKQIEKIFSKFADIVLFTWIVRNIELVVC